MRPVQGGQRGGDGGRAQRNGLSSLGACIVVWTDQCWGVALTAALVPSSMQCKQQVSCCTKAAGEECTEGKV